MVFNDGVAIFQIRSSESNFDIKIRFCASDSKIMATPSLKNHNFEVREQYFIFSYTKNIWGWAQGSVYVKHDI